ncbi:MAG: AI-2E family transporter [Bryobacteraceae bacterium]|nr:AI-2E family transporter [Bryobacteraceae bacterium]
MHALGLDPRVIRIVWTAAVCYALWYVRGTLFLFAVAILLAYVLLPLVEWVTHRVVARRRGLALAVVYIAAISAIGLALTLVGTFAAQQAKALAKAIPGWYNRLASNQIPWPASIRPYVERAVEELNVYIQTHTEDILGAVSSAGLQLMGAIGSIFSVIVVLVLSFFLLKEGEAWARAIVGSLPKRYQPVGEAIAADLHNVMGKYTRSMFLVALLTVILYGVVFSLLGVPYAILLSVVAFPFEFLPIVGPSLAFAIVVLVCIFSGFKGWVLLIVSYILMRLFQDYVMQPYLMNEGMSLSPLLVFFGVLAGQQLGGIAGAVLAVPMLAILRVFYVRLREVE